LAGTAAAVFAVRVSGAVLALGGYFGNQLLWNFSEGGKPRLARVSFGADFGLMLPPAKRHIANDVGQVIGWQLRKVAPGVVEEIV